MQRRVRAIFEKLEKDCQGVRWETVDASKTMEEVERTIRGLIKELEAGVEGSVGRLWVEG